jgi:hypothetical protein
MLKAHALGTPNPLKIATEASVTQSAASQGNNSMIVKGFDPKRKSRQKD